MELLFTWIENYRNIKKQGINFSAEYDISFDSNTNVLSVKKAHNYISSFFGKFISNISVIVGKNGTGKTSILNFGEATFYLGRNKNNYFVVCKNQEWLNKIILSEDNYINIDKCDYSKPEDTLMVQYSNFIDSYIEDSLSHLANPNNVIDLSTNKLAHQFFQFKDIDYFSFDSNSEPIDKQVQMHISEISTQMTFLLKNEYNEILNFKTPEKITISFNIDYELELLKQQAYGKSPWTSEPNVVYENIFKTFFEFHLNESCYHKKVEEGWKVEYKNLKITEKEYTMFLLKWSIFFSFIRSFSSPNIDGDGIEEWFKLIPSWENTPINDWFKDFFEKKIIGNSANVGRKQVEQVKAWSENVSSFINKFEYFLNRIPTIITAKTSFFEHDFKSFRNLVEIEVDIYKNDNGQIIFDLFISEYNKIIKPNYWRKDNFPFLNFSWRGVSSGEISLLRIFSRFYSLIESIRIRRNVPSALYTQSQIKNLIFLIDEGEIGLHPSWQQQFLSKLIDNLPPMFEDVGIESIQLILTTHSPFILSDVPNNHVIFLEKDSHGNCVVIKNPLNDKKMTFGANIHSLLSDGFFMKEGLMGDFAKKKINELIDDLIEKGNQLSSERKSEIQQMIPLIGEPLIRKKVMDLYNEQINLNIDDRIRLLEESKNQLEKDIEMLKSKSK